ncbi:complement C1q tumor necrosis factor-related protein 3-like [Mercenaria mercenaria]|uniref:complement C1q tumor necrosis factor-related protein 3-like n=1 Tax=Mercenaria mercenaria TaxID=6596 RepID=UPI001E1E123D|nr:complement C1q tumor necrosis factor-related protein 3-like [Mercenaria mercenaria]
MSEYLFVSIISLVLAFHFAAGSAEDGTLLEHVVERLNQKDTEIDMLMDRVRGMEQELTGLRAQCSGKGGQQKRDYQKRANENNVAFYVEMWNFTVHAQAHQNLIFDRVTTNIGTGYDSKSGIFEAPVPGVYVFSVTMMADPSHYDRYQIMKNGSELLGNMLAHAPTNAYDTTAQTIVVVLQAGDQISVQHSDPDGFAHGHLYSTFAGFLQQEDYSTIVG